MFQFRSIYPIQLEASQQQLSALYQDLVQPEPESETQPPPLLPSEPTLTKMDALFHQIQALNPQEKSDLLNLLKIDDTPQQSPLWNTVQCSIENNPSTWYVTSCNNIRFLLIFYSKINLIFYFQVVQYNLWLPLFTWLGFWIWSFGILLECLWILKESSSLGLPT